MIRTEGLTKRFGSVLAVDDVALDVAPGEIYGFLGANGSGKTTTVRCLLGLVLPTAGHIELLGRPMPKSGREVLPKVGALVEGPAAYGHLSGQANLVLFDASGRRRGGPLGGGRRDRADRARRALEVVGLADVGRRPVRAYSLGMRQRLGIAAALLRQPELLVLDEPTNGLDPQGTREVRTLLQELHAAGTTIFMSSHLLPEVDQLCTRIGLLDRGRLVLQESLATLRAPTGRTVVVTPDIERAAAVLGSSVADRNGERVVVATADSAAVNARLVAAGVAVRELGPERRSLEQVIEERTSVRQPGEVAR
jgi:ABC-2 type transport system ATP-binding protein